MLKLAPRRAAPASPVDRPQVFPVQGERRKRVALLSGCVQPVLKPSINEATIRLLNRHGVEVVVSEGAGCCGALTHHLGEEAPAIRSAKANIAAWWREIEGEGLDAIVDQRLGLRHDGEGLRLPAAQRCRSGRRKRNGYPQLARDITEVMSGAWPLAPLAAIKRPGVAYHSACSMQHGQKLNAAAARPAQGRRFRVAGD